MSALLKTVTATVLAGALLASATASAPPQQRVPPGERPDILSHLEDGHPETPIATSLDHHGLALAGRHSHSAT